MFKIFLTTLAAFYGTVFADCQEICQRSETTPPVIVGIILIESSERMIAQERANQMNGVCTEHLVLPGDRYCLEGRLYQKVLNQCFCEKWLDIAKCEIME